MKVLFISGFLSFALLGCYSTAQPKAKFEEPEREQCYQECLGSLREMLKVLIKSVFVLLQSIRKDVHVLAGMEYEILISLIYEF